MLEPRFYPNCKVVAVGPRGTFPGAWPTSCFFRFTPTYGGVCDRQHDYLQQLSSTHTIRPLSTCMFANNMLHRPLELQHSGSGSGSPSPSYAPTIAVPWWAVDYAHILYRSAAATPVTTTTMTQAAPAKRRKIANGPTQVGGQPQQQQQRRHYDQIDNEAAGGELELDLERELDLLIRSPALYDSASCLPLAQRPLFVDVNTNTNEPELFASSSYSSSSSYTSPSLSPSIDSFAYSSSSSPYLSSCTTSSPASPSSHTPTTSPTTTMSVFVPPPMAEDTATVTLTHKPRGSHGAWRPLDDGQRIRYARNM